MAHNPKLKAAAVADLLTGLSANKVAVKYKIGKATVIQWSKELKEAQNQPGKPTKTDRSVSEEIRQRRFDEALERFLTSTIGMLQVWATECSDPRFIRENPTGVNALGQSVLDRAERIMANIRESEPSQAED
jgi:hypothetical protein